MVKPTLMFAAGDLTRDLKQDHKRGGSAYYVHTFVICKLTPQRQRSLPRLDVMVQLLLLLLLI